MKTVGMGSMALACDPILSQPTVPSQKSNPNIIFFMADELGYYELSCMGHPEFKTPNIDRFAAEGIRFTQTLAGAPVCAPTRSCLMTGQHMGHTTVRTNGGYAPLRWDDITIADMLKRTGYVTGGFGKWGLGGRGTSGVPEAHGFDVFFGYYDQRHAHSYYPPYLIRNNEEVPLPGNTGDYYEGDTFSHSVIMEEAKTFIRQHCNDPFFCYLPVTPPHGLWGFPKDDPSWELYRDEPWTAGQRTPDDAKVYAAMVNMLDRNLGEIHELLSELGIEENTIIFFCGDNGGEDYFPSPERPRGFFGPNVNPKNGVAFRGQKRELYEGGLRVPMIVRWPGMIRPGQISDHLWYFPDVMPTLAELTASECPDYIDGISIVPTLLGEESSRREQDQHEYLYWEYQDQVAVRTDRWKAIRPGENDTAWELYDLSRDPEERFNIAADHAERLMHMIQISEQAHTALRPGEIYDEALALKDHNANQR